MDPKGTRAPSWRAILAVAVAVVGFALPAEGRTGAPEGTLGCAPTAATAGALHLAAAKQRVKPPAVRARPPVAPRARPQRLTPGRAGAATPPPPQQRAEPAEPEAGVILTLYTCVAGPGGVPALARLRT